MVLRRATDFCLFYNMKTIEVCGCVCLDVESHGENSFKLSGINERFRNEWISIYIFMFTYFPFIRNECRQKSYKKTIVKVERSSSMQYSRCRMVCIATK